MSLLFRGLRPAEAPYTEQLRALSIDPAGVERVIMTHLHVDHTSGMRLLPRAEFTCARAEWSAAHERLAAVRGYVKHHLPPDSRMQLVDFEADGEPCEPGLTLVPTHDPDAWRALAPVSASAKRLAGAGG